MPILANGKEHIVDAISYLKDDHRNVEVKFVAFERLGPRAHKGREKIVREVIAALSKHAAIEEAHVYPEARQRLANSAELVLEALEEHHLVKVTLAELSAMNATDERFDAKFSVLVANVRRHVKEEERVLFPAMRNTFSKRELVEMGSILAEASTSASTRPHPNAPDVAPLNAIAAAVSKPLDTLRDIGDAVMVEARKARRSVKK